METLTKGSKIIGLLLIQMFILIDCNWSLGGFYELIRKVTQCTLTQIFLAF